MLEKWPSLHSTLPHFYATVRFSPISTVLEAFKPVSTAENVRLTGFAYEANSV